MNVWSLIKDETAGATLRALNKERDAWLDWKPYAGIKAALAQLPEEAAGFCDFDRAEVTIGIDRPEDDPIRMAAETAAREILPWKKGPYRLFGLPIDAEWRSDFKWDRMAGQLPAQTGKSILDVGCNNGYYLFRLLPQKPAFVLGIDPVPRPWYQFKLLQHFARVGNLDFQPWGWQELTHFHEAFDTIFCMGILYHHTDPMGMLKLLHRALKPKGLLVMESIIIPGGGDLCLYPEDRYARMRNVWFVPTLSAMCHMLRRSKFTDIREVACNRHLPAEQRTTAWNPGPSYEAFLDPNDEGRTIEGYPAPHRAIVFASKK